MSIQRVFLLLCVCLIALIAVEAVDQQRFTRHAPASASSPSSVDSSMLESESTLSSSTSHELVSSLKVLLEQRRQADEAARAKLEAAAERTLAVEHALAEKSAQLKNHNKMMARLEACINDGPAQQRLEEIEKQMKQKQQSLLEQNSHLETQVETMKEQEKAMNEMHKQNKNLEQLIQQKDNELKKKQIELDAQHSLLATREQSLAQRESTLLTQLNEAARVKANQEAEIEKRVNEKVASIQASLIEEKNKAIAHAKTEAQAEVTSLLEKQQHMIESDKLASRIASKHEMKRLTSTDTNVELSTYDPFDNVMIESAAKLSHQHKNSSSPSSIDQPNRCQRFTDCSSCGADGGCAWCSSTGQCLSLDVNANYRTNAVGDGLTSGQCPADSWQTTVSSRLTLLSLNVFASDHGNSTKRFAAIVQLFKKTGADVIALQEVEKWFIHALQAHSWVKANYHFTDFGPGQAPGGLYILSRYPISSQSYYEEIQPGQITVSERGRVLVATLGVRQHAVTVATTNLDWRESQTRAHNLDYVFHILKQWDHVFLLGDFNFDEGAKPESEHIPSNFLDVWSTLNPENPGFTWDPRHNWFAAFSDPHSRSSRIDRILLRSNQWMPRSIHLVGCSVADPLCASKNLNKKNPVSIVNPTSDLANPSVLVGQKDNTPKVEAGSPKKVVQREPASFIETEQTIVSAVDAEETAFLEQSMEVSGLFHGDFVPSNHYGLLVQATHFHPKC